MVTIENNTCCIWISLYFYNIPQYEIYSGGRGLPNVILRQLAVIHCNMAMIVWFLFIITAVIINAVQERNDTGSDSYNDTTALRIVIANELNDLVSKMGASEHDMVKGLNQSLFDFLFAPDINFTLLNID